ncbi:MAG: endo-1,4-beta-xylanase [Fibrobacter sp.]|nr:endo-1,4-beta-xylanase [Fibrobacter sp.]
MKQSFAGRIAMVCAAVLTLNTALFAQTDSTLRQLAEARGRFVGAILNSNWFSYGLGDDAEVYENTHKSQFNIVVAENEMKFDATEPARNSFNFKNGDKLMAYAAANGMQVRGHALAWHSQVPDWVPKLAESVAAAGGSPKDTLLAVLKNHIENVVGHYKGKIREWDVVNEAIDGTPAAWRDGSASVWYKYIGREFIDSAFVWAHKADPDARLYYNDYSLEWGVAEGSKGKFAVDSVAKRLRAAGIYITGIGCQTHISDYHVTTPQNVKALAQMLEAEGMTLQITELDIGFDKKTATQSDYEAQGSLYRQFMDLFLEAPNMEAFVIWGFSDKYSWLADLYKYNGLIFDSSFAAKPAYDSLVASLKAHSADKVTKVKDAIPLVWENTSPFGKASYVIVDYSQPGAESRGEWSGDVKNGNGKFVGDALAGKTGYMNVPLAGCDQNADYCGYQHAIYTLPQDAVDSNLLSKCEALVFTAYGPGGSTAYVNIGINDPKMTLQNGRPLSSKVWAGMTVDLQAVRDADVKPTQLTFNSSNTSAMYISKIEAVGCPDENSATPVTPSGIKSVAKAFEASGRVVRFDGKQLFVPSSAQVELFDMQGRPVFTARDIEGVVSLSSVAKGLYVVRVRVGSQSLVRQIVVK